jgi:hypothetical protein
MSKSSQIISARIANRAERCAAPANQCKWRTRSRLAQCCSHLACELWQIGKLFLPIDESEDWCVCVCGHNKRSVQLAMGARVAMIRVRESETKTSRKRGGWVGRACKCQVRFVSRCVEQPDARGGYGENDVLMLANTGSCPTC